MCTSNYTVRTPILRVSWGKCKRHDLSFVKKKIISKIFKSFQTNFKYSKKSKFKEHTNSQIFSYVLNLLQLRASFNELTNQLKD